MDLDLILFSLTVAFFALGPLALAWPAKLTLGNWPGMLVVALLFGGLGYLWIADFGATLGVWAFLLAYFVDPHAGTLRRASRRRVAATPLALISQAPLGRLVAVEGRVVADGETLPVPLLGGACVWRRVRVLEEVVRGSGKSRHREWSTRHDQVQQRAFHLADQSGRIARVELGDAVPSLDVRQQSVGLFDSPSPAEQELLRAAGVDWTREFGMNRTLRIEISALRAGDVAYACGVASHAGSDAPLVVRAADGDPVGVIFGGGNRAAVLKRLAWWRS